MAAKELVEYVAKSLVDDPEAVKVTEVEDEEGTVIELHVAEDDMGKVIGRNGSVAKALRIQAEGMRIRRMQKAEERAAAGFVTSGDEFPALAEGLRLELPGAGKFFCVALARHRPRHRLAGRLPLLGRQPPGDDQRRLPVQG